MRGATAARSFSLRKLPRILRRMRHCRNSSIGSGKPVREVILSWVQNRLKLSRVAIAALLATAAASAAANVLVVRSSGPSAKSYAPGSSLPDNARLQLRAGDTVVVLDSRGTRTFRGPGTFSPATAAPAGTQTVQGNSGRRARIGAGRRPRT